ncbi:hypothetical protein P8886_21655, partial [Bacillus haynesii]|nr:hypothetical protein [Bacillus haynesii]
ISNGAFLDVQPKEELLSVSSTIKKGHKLLLNFYRLPFHNFQYCNFLCRVTTLLKILNDMPYKLLGLKQLDTKPMLIFASFHQYE